MSQNYSVMEQVKFRDWIFLIAKSLDRRDDYLQVQFAVSVELTDSEYIETVTQRGRKWRLSPHMTDGEVVQTALMAVLAALEHEAREEFTYKGKAIFGPHFDLEALVEIADRTSVRETM